MSPPEDIDFLSREELLALVLQLQRKLIELEASVQDLRGEVDWLTREKKRQAAPFSKGTRVRQPKRPGRKPGQGTFSFRQSPRPEEITEPPRSCASDPGLLPRLRRQTEGTEGGSFGKAQDRLRLPHRPSSAAPSQSDPVPSAGLPLHRLWPSSTRRTS